MDEWTSIDSHPIPEELLDLVKPELAPGERLLWAARQTARVPRGRKSWVGPAWAGGFFLVSGTTFAALFGAFGPKFPVIEGLLAGVGLLSGIIGVFCAIGIFRLWVERSLEARRTVKVLSYALTERRAIVWRPIAWTDGVGVLTYARGKIQQLRRVEYPDGSGDVVFEEPTELHPFPQGFIGVGEVRRVEDLVRRALIDPVSET